MTVISIGTSGSITYSTTDNFCYDSSNGSIDISSIIFDDLSGAFSEYTINWTSDNYAIDSNQIRDNGRSIILLYNDTYHFTIESLSSSSSLGPYDVTVSSPNQFGIVGLKSSSYSCGENGDILVSVSGGVPPYYFNIGSNSTSQSSPEYLATGLVPASYIVQITDSNGCVATNLTDVASTIIIKDANFTINDIIIYQPQILDSYGRFDITISGYGPFSFSFDGPNNVNYGGLDTTNLISYDNSTNIYKYSFVDILTPGNYNVVIKNTFGCSSTIPITIPNLNPISVSMNVSPNNKSTTIVPKLSYPIYDTIFIPFSNIQNNSSLWNLIQKFIQQNKVDLKINNSIVTHKISKNFLYPYCIDNNKIEIVRLDNNSDNWFFCFHIGPGIDLLNNLNIINNEIFFIDKNSNQEYKCLLGLNTDNQISHDYPSLLMGSFFIQGINTEQFPDGSTINLKISSVAPNIDSDYDFTIKNINNYIYYNLYNNSYMTSLYFLDNFNVLIENIDINQTACSISNEDFQYIQNIKQMLLAMNNFNNYQSLYIFNQELSDIGSISLFVTGNTTALLNNNEIVDNIFSINYFTFNENSDKLYSFYSNNRKIYNTTQLNNISDGYVIIRITDTNNNKVKFINLNNNTITYDNHFLNVQNILQEFNPKIKSLFEYGDILVYVPKSVESTNNPEITNSIPTFTPPIINQAGTTVTNLSSSTINQSHDTTNTATISIVTDPQNAVCYLIGPKNYKKQFVGYTIFDNVVPGVYNIVGDDTYLQDNSLYQNNTRAIILKNQDYNISIKFNSYLDKVFIKE